MSEDDGARGSDRFMRARNAFTDKKYGENRVLDSNRKLHFERRDLAFAAGGTSYDSE